MQLEKPHIQYKSQFITALKEFQSEETLGNNDVYKLNIPKIEKDFESYITLLQQQERGENLPALYVPQSKFWLVDNDEVIGVVSIRHRLTNHLLKEGGNIGYAIRPSKRKQGYGRKILELGLIEAKKLGLEKVLLTCNDTNIASQKIITACGGVQDTLLPLEIGKPNKLRYWITLS